MKIPLMAQTVKKKKKKIYLQCKKFRFDPWVGKMPWRREWLSTPAFLLEESHGQISLVGYSSQVAKSRTPLSN